MNKIRCAIYTRKSSEEGLEQDFNSLHAQREACAAYILSQASEGWSLLPGDYDDGGLSGGTLERPALKRLIADIEAGRIDIVVVYKVDRLTRSLLDFARLVESFDRAGVSFVSVTQSFNTTTSMGRLTLNMLLSFAQFEREVTAERIRDKIAASKARGMWMGGNPPLGYRPDGRSLAVVETHAELIRTLFRRYLDIGNVRMLAEVLEAEGTRVPQRTALTGKPMGGGLFTRGQIYKILSNPIYIGEIHHRGKVYPGKHQAIIDRDMWDAVQARLTDNTQGQQRSTSAKSPSLLAGRVFDEAGERLVAAHACKGKVRYRYYVSRSLQHEAGSRTAKGIRVPALELEKTVAEAVARRFDDPLDLATRASLQPRPDEVDAFSTAATQVAARLRKRDRSVLRALIANITIERERIAVALSGAAIARQLLLQPPASAGQIVTLAIDARIRRSGVAVRLIHAGGKAAAPPEPQEHLVRLLAKSRSWWRELVDEQLTVSKLAARHKVTTSYTSRLVRLNFLAPELVEAILAGEQRPGIDATTLLNLSDMPLSWSEQKRDLAIV